MKAILLIALIASAFAATDFSDFKRIEKRELGKTLMNTIAIQLTAGEPLEHLFDMLFTLEHRYQEDQKEDDANNRTFQDACDSDLKELNREIAESESKSSDLQGLLDSLHPERDQKEGSRKAKVISRAQVQAVVDEATQLRSGEADTFEKKRQEYEYVTARLSEARRIFDENLVAFVQNGKVNHGQVMAQVEKVLGSSPAKLSNLVHAVHYGKAIKMLAQLAGRNKQVANQELTGKVVKLIEDLQNQMYQAFDLERKTEDDRIGAFNKYVALLQKDINKYNSDIANLEAEIASLDDRIAATQASKDDTDQRTEDKTTQRDDRRAECDQATYDYQQRRLNRDSDRQTVSDLIGLLNSKMRELREYIALRTSAGESD